ncbi:hypothetical protein [Bradyrhizobium sp. LTSPM299]|uniref:hypothetical protein n=1 Tax=Bradyrhizobium sp. LTSPM299 TaxID=1619233 RepID=UPI0012E10993|nr:hypothetical protein [Bradyrhizobium sp. LTSPM299]
MLQDPSSLQTSLDLLRHSVAANVDSSPNLSGMDRANITSAVLADSERTLVRAAAFGAISQNPEAGYKEFSSPKYAQYLSASDLKTLEQQQRAVVRAEHVDQAYQRTQRQQQKQDASDQREGEYIAKLHSDDPQQQQSVNAKSIANDFTLTREARERMIGIVERTASKENSATDPATRNRLLDGMLSADKPTKMQDILQAQIDNKLSNKDATILKEMIGSGRGSTLSDPVFTGVMGAAKQQIEQSLEGAENYGKFFYGFVRDYQKQAVAGTLQPNALDLRDEKSLISQYVKQYQPSNADKIRYYMFKNLGTDPSTVDFSQVVPRAVGDMSPGGGSAPARPARVTTKDQYDELPVGTHYIGKDGQTYEKRSSQPSAAPVSR